MKANKAVATPEYIGDVMNGRRNTIPLQHQPDPKLPLALWVQDADKPTVLLEITDCWHDGEGWTVHIRPWTFEDTPRLLRAGSPLTGGGKARLVSARKRRFKTIRAKAPDGDKFSDDQASGYTPNPSIALLDAGEAVDIETQDRLTLAAIGRDAKRRREQSIHAQRERELLTVLQRIQLAKTTAAQNGITIHAEVKAITRMQERGRSEGLIQAELERVERIVYKEAA